MVSRTPFSKSYSGTYPSSSITGVISHCQLRCFIILYLSEFRVLLLPERVAMNSANKDITFSTINGHFRWRTGWQWNKTAPWCWICGTSERERQAESCSYNNEIRITDCSTVHAVSIRRGLFCWGFCHRGTPQVWYQAKQNTACRYDRKLWPQRQKSYTDI